MGAVNWIKPKLMMMRMAKSKGYVSFGHWKYYRRTNGDGKRETGVVSFEVKFEWQTKFTVFKAGSITQTASCCQLSSAGQLAEWQVHS